MANFQQSVQTVPAPGVEGDFNALNPFFTFDAGPGGIVAGANGVTVGRFVWFEDNYYDPDNAPQVVNNFGAGPVAGFIHREQQGLITVYLQETGLLVPQGFPVTVFTGGDLWVKNYGTTQATMGQSVYATLANGQPTFASTSSSATSSSVAAETNAFTGSIAGNILSVSAVGSGTIYPGTTIAGSGVTSGSMIMEQLTGTAGGVGTYALNYGEQSVSSESMTGAYGLLTVGTLTGTAFGVGNAISGTNVVAGTQITVSVTGSGGTGATMVVNNNTVVSSTTITSAQNVVTKWAAMSQGNPGEIVKISDHLLG